MEKHFLQDYTGIIKDMFFILQPDMLQANSERAVTLLPPITSFIENCPSGITIHAVTDAQFGQAAKAWLAGIAIPYGVDVQIQAAAPTGKLPESATWARDHLIVRWMDGELDFLATGTDKVTSDMQTRGEAAFASWLSPTFASSLSEAYDVFLPGGNVLSGNQYWITNRVGNFAEDLESLSGQKLIYMDYDTRNKTEEIDRFIESQLWLYRQAQKRQMIMSRHAKTARDLQFLSEEILRDRVDRDGGYVSFGLHADNYLSLTGIVENNLPVVLLARRVAVNLSPQTTSWIERQNEFLDRTEDRLCQQGLRVYRNPIPVTADSTGSIADRWYNNVLVETGIRPGADKPLVFMPVFGHSGLDLTAFNHANTEIWQGLGFRVHSCEGWDDVAFAEGALRCAFNVLRRS